MQNKEDFNFIQERVKKKPYNRKKLLRKMITTIATAVIFGLVSCFTFFLLEPVFNHWIRPEEDTLIFRFPEDENEITLEDIVTSDSELESEEVDITEWNQIHNYQSLYQELYNVAEDVMRSMVTMESVVSEVDWFDNPYEQKGRTSGFIVANNGQELIMIAHYNEIHNQDDIRITFYNETQVTASVKKIDEELQLIAVAVPLSSISEETKEFIEVASLGISTASRIIATPVIAIGSPLGVQNSVMYGMVTSAGNLLAITDSAYRYFTTDMEGDMDASGVIVNLQGQIIGIIAQQYTRDGKEFNLGAIGITELKGRIEKISNGLTIPYLGIYPIDVPESIHNSQNIPYGAYVSNVELNSPAMMQGIQSGDIIVDIDGIEIYNSANYVTILMTKEVGSSINVKLMRQSASEYKEMVVSIEL